MTSIIIFIVAMLFMSTCICLSTEMCCFVMDVEVPPFVRKWNIANTVIATALVIGCFVASVVVR